MKCAFVAMNISHTVCIDVKLQKLK